MNTTLELKASERLTALKPLNPKIDRPVYEPKTDDDGPPNSTNHTPAPATESTPAAKKPSHKRKIVIGAGLLLVALALTGYYLHDIAPYESTDDAFIEAHVSPVSAQVAGRVLKLDVKDNEQVHAGDVLVELDPRDFQVRVDQAKADLAAANSRLEQARAQLAVDESKAAQEKASVDAADAEASRAEADYKRFKSVEVRAISRSQLDLAEAQARASKAEVTVASNRAAAAQAQVELSRASIASRQADVTRGEATVHQAELDLSYTKVIAPQDGLVTRRTVEPGAYVQTGQSLLAVVPTNVWVVANFKETQLSRMHTGQPVTVTVDAFPHAKFQARIDTIQAGSGARFSLLPPENASGNFVKVVQRVPVKIVFEPGATSGYLLGVGMSVTPEVKVN